MWAHIKEDNFMEIIICTGREVSVVI